MSNCKTKRGNNFSTEEELLLLEEIAKHKNVLENKKTNNISSNEKNESWKKVLTGFNSNNLYPRTLDQLKSKYDNLKTKARKWAADKKFDFKGTGGGPGTLLHSDPVLEAVINIINYKTVCGLIPICDDDVEDTYSITTQNEIECEQQNSSSSVPPTSLEVTSLDVNENENIIIYYEDTAEPSNPVENSPLAKKVKRAVSKEIHPATNPKEKNLQWNNYTTKMLKEPVNKRLRPKVPNPVFTAKEEYYQKKTELTQVIIEDIKRKANEEAIRFEEKQVIANNKEAREQEEHGKRMTLLDLQIRTAQNNLDRD